MHPKCSKFAAMTIGILTILVSFEAFASKARVNSLQGAIGLVDTQTIFAQPAYIHKLGQYVTYEFGATSTGASATSTKAEGGFLIAREQARWGAYLGHVSTRQADLRTGFLGVENPVDLFFGRDEWAATLSLSNSQNERTDSKQSLVSGRLGKLNGPTELYIGIEGIAAAEQGTSKLTAAPEIAIGYLSTIESLSYSLDVSYGFSRTEIAGTTTDTKTIRFDAALNHRPVAEIYYGAGLSVTNSDIGGQKRDVLRLPVFIGLEKDLFSWMTVRGSIKQNFFFGSTKDETLAAPNDRAIKNANDTSVAAGLGFKHAGFSFDGVAAVQTTGAFNSTAFLTNASLTYVF